MIEVREYCDTDLNYVNEILNEAFNTSKRNFKNPNFKELVVCVDGKVAGYLLLTKILNPIKERFYYLVDYVCVSSNYRRMGLARKMLEEVYKIAKGNNAIYIQLTSSIHREAAHKLYLSCGYVKRESNIFRKDII
jgi:ribosomal protein S18 acetylase RimI-like enzyme